VDKGPETFGEPGKEESDSDVDSSYKEWAYEEFFSVVRREENHNKSTKRTQTEEAKVGWLCTPGV
jgi:hypothetical protein